jgi:WD40 repeat protein
MHQGETRTAAAPCLGICLWLLCAACALGVDKLTIEEVMPQVTTGSFGRVACFVNKSHLLVVGGSDTVGQVRLLDANTGDVLQKLGSLKDGTCSLCSSEDGSRVAGGSNAGEMEVWSLPDGRSVKKLAYNSLKPARQMFVSLDSTGKRLLVASGSDGKVRDYGISDGPYANVFDFTKREGTKSNHAYDLFWITPDKRLALRGLQHTFSFPFNERGDTYRLGFESKVPSVVVRGAGTAVLFISGKDWMLRDAETGMLVKSWTDGPRLASLGRVDKWTADYDAKRDGWAVGASQSELTTDGTKGLTTTGLLVYINGKTGDATRVIKVGENAVKCVKVSSDGKYVCAANEKDELLIWKLDELLKPGEASRP